MSHKCQSILHAPNGRLLGELASVSADLAHGHVIPEHSHPEDQLLFASSGVWIPADTPHSVAMSGPVSMRTLYFLPRLCKEFSEKCFVMNVSALLRELILHACTFKRLSKKALAERRIIEVIVDQLKAVDSIPLQLPHPTDSRALRVVKVLLADPGDQRDLERLCEDCGASKRTIQRVFLEETKMNFGKWRQQLRLLHGLQLMASGEKVTAAALEAGYSSPSAFISMFRKQLGTTPMRYLGDANGRGQLGR